MKNKNQFWHLVLEASNAWEKYDNPKLYEPKYVDLLKFVKSKPDFKPHFVNYFIEIVNDPKKGVWEIVAFCMRELQWLEVQKKVFEIKKQSHDHRSIPIYDDILSVYNEDWEDSDLWSYYSK